MIGLSVLLIVRFLIADFLMADLFAAYHKSSIIKSAISH